MSSFDRPEYPDGDRKPLLKYVPESAGKILDVGCHRGAFGRAIKKERVAEVWGIEPDLESSSAARECLDHVITDFFQADNPIPDSYFDLITFNDSLEHMVNPAQALELCKKKLGNKGRVHCCVPNIRHIDNLEHLILDKDWQYEDLGIRDRTHLRFFTEKSIIRLFQETGFRVIETIGIREDWYQPSKPFRRIFFRLFPNFTRDMRYIQFLVIAEPT